MTKPVALGIDIGGTKTLCLLVNKDGEILRSEKFKTAEDGADQFRKDLLRTVWSLRDYSQRKKLKLLGVGVGLAGSMDEKKGRIKTAPNLLCLEGFPIERELKKALDAKVFVGNDVQVGICAEHKLGAAKGCSNVLGVFFGTGVGGSVIIENKLYTGACGMGGQVGSVLAQPVGGPKAALSHGFLDRIASKAAITGEALIMAVKEWAPYLHRKVGTDLSKVTWGLLQKAVDRGDKRIEEMLRARMHVVGIALSSIINFLNPDMIVLGGGLLAEMPKLALEEIEGGLREYLVPEVSACLKVRTAALGSDAVALGAANLVFEHSQNGK
jgi:glucokinase